MDLCCRFVELCYLILWVACVVLCWSGSSRAPAPSELAPANSPQFDVEAFRKMAREKFREVLQGNGCTCELCTRVKDHPELLLDGKGIRTLQEAILTVGTGRAHAGVTCIDGISPRGMLSLRLVCVSGEVYSTMLEPILVREFGQDWRARS